MRAARGITTSRSSLPAARSSARSARPRAARRKPSPTRRSGDAMSTPLIGAPVSRIDGRAKVTGAAKYAGEFDAPGLAYGAVVTATIARGRIAAIDTDRARSIVGIVDILTHENRPPLPSNDKAYQDDTAPKGRPYRPLYDDRILFDGQPIALVIAEDWESARLAASLVEAAYEREDPATDLHAHRDW